MGSDELQRQVEELRAQHAALSGKVDDLNARLEKLRGVVNRNSERFLNAVNVLTAVVKKVVK